jgi:hypothetical protein
MDWLGHHNDIAQWGLGVDESGPSQVEVKTWTMPETDIYNTPAHYEIACRYPSGVVSSISDRHRGGIKWIGDQGWVYVTRGKLDASERRWTAPDFDPGSFKIEDTGKHARNFLDCVKSRNRCVAPAEIAHRSVTSGHLAYVAAAVGVPLNWDAQAERILGNDEAQRLLMEVSYRKPW